MSYFFILGVLYLVIWSWIPGSGQSPGDPILFLISDLNFWPKYIYISLCITSHILIWGVYIWISGARAVYLDQDSLQVINFIFDIKIEILSQINVWIDIHNDFLRSLAGYLDLDLDPWIRTASRRSDLIIFSKLNVLAWKTCTLLCSVILGFGYLSRSTWSRTASSSLKVNGGWGNFYFRLGVVCKYRSLHKKFHAYIS